MKAITASLPFLEITGCSHGLSQENHLIAKTENRIRFPKSAAPLWAYRRHYTWSEPRKIGCAVYNRGGRPDRLWLPLEEMPIFLHGGCKVVSLSFYVVIGRAYEMTC